MKLSTSNPPARPAVLEPFGAPFIEAVHPVPQRLAVHATDPRGIGPTHPIQHRRKRQQTPTLVGVLGGRRKTPQLVGRKVRPHRHRCRHGTNPPAPWNQLNIERGIANESERKAVGIRRSPERSERGWRTSAPSVRVEAVELVPHRLHLPCRRLKWDVELTDEPGRSE